MKLSKWWHDFASVYSSITMVTFFGWLEVEPDYDRVIGSCCFPGNTQSHHVAVQKGHVSILVPRANKLQYRSGFPRQTSFTVAFTIQLGWLYCREHLEWFSSTIVMFQCFLIVSLSVSCSPLSVSDSSAIKHSSDVDGVGWSGINWKLAMHVTRQGHKQNSNYNNGELLEVCLCRCTFLWSWGVTGHFSH